MLLHQQKKRVNPKENNSIDGIYVPKERRIEQQKDFKGAHFTLGNTNKSKCDSARQIANNRFKVSA